MVELTYKNHIKLQIVGDRGSHSQSTMHGFDPNTRVIFYADIGRDALSCWNTDLPLQPNNIGILAQDTKKLSYPSGKVILLRSL